MEEQAIFSAAADAGLEPELGAGAAAVSHWSAAELQLAPVVQLGRWLEAQGYSFRTVTPSTHQRVQLREPDEPSLRDIFGWSRSFLPRQLPEPALELLRRAGALEQLADGRLRSRIRFSTLDGQLFVHSAYPTVAADAVFFGPDTYRFARLIQRALLQRHAHPVRSIVDIGAGSGAGGLFAARLLGQPELPRLVLADLSPAALRCAQINAALAGFVGVEHRSSDVLRGVEGRFDLILCNPPYLSDPAARLYRNGGGLYGAELSLRIVRESLPRLAPGGRLVLYTGAAVVEGVDVFRREVEPLLRAAQARFDYEEIDPDVFGEELEQPAYAQVERIAVVGLVAHAPAPAAA